MYHGLRELGAVYEEKETPDILAARLLRGKCYLNMAKYQSAQNEAENVLKFDAGNVTAMYVLGESLYLQCKVKFKISYVTCRV